MTSIDTWAEGLARQYGIMPSTVLEIRNGFEGRVYDGSHLLTRRERTEKFLELYFEEVRRER